MDPHTLSRFCPENEEFRGYMPRFLTKQQRILPNPQEKLLSSFETETSTMCFPFMRGRLRSASTTKTDQPKPATFLSIQKPKWRNKHNTRTQERFNGCKSRLPFEVSKDRDTWKGKMTKTPSKNHHYFRAFDAKSKLTS